MHAQTNTETWDIVLSGVANRGDLALSATIAKTARNEDPVGSSKQSFSIFLFDFFGFDAVEFNANRVGDAAMDQRLEQTLVRFF